MTVQDSIAKSAAAQTTKPPRWARMLLGGIMALAGLAVLADVAFASLISSAFLGTIAIAVGAFEIIHAIWAKDWAGLSWQLLLGLMYVALGLLLVGMATSSVMVLSYILVRSTGQPELLLTYCLGLLLLLSGFVRLLLGWSRWHQSGWVMVLSGTFGLAAGVVVLAEFPKTGLWIFGLLLGIDLIVHGAAWLGYAFERDAGSAMGSIAQPSRPA